MPAKLVARRVESADVVGVDVFGRNRAYVFEALALHQVTQPTLSVFTRLSALALSEVLPGNGSGLPQPIGLPHEHTGG